MKIRLAFLFLFIAGCQPASAALAPTPLPAADTFFVSPDGDDTNPGTSALPWRTIQKAADFGNGTIYVSDGVYPERVKVSRSNLSFMADGRVEMNGFNVAANNVSIEGFYVTDTPDENPDGYGFYVTGSGCRIENNHVFFATRGGILLDVFSDGCIVANNKLQRNAIFGLEVRGANHVVEANEIWETIQYHPRWSNPPSWVDADGIRFFGSGHVIAGNYIHDIHYGIPENVDPHIDCFQTWGDAGRGLAHGILFEKNLCINSETMTGLAGKAWQIEDGAYDLTMRNNVVYANLIAIISDSHDILFVNNTFVGDSNNEFSQGIKIFNTSNVTVVNNVFAYQENGIGSIWSDDLVSGASLSAGYNCVFRAGGSPWRTKDPGDVWGMPLSFVDEEGGNYRLAPNSPCVDKGSVQDVTTDFDGVERPQGAGYDIGAYELVVP